MPYYNTPPYPLYLGDHTVGTGPYYYEDWFGVGMMFLELLGGTTWQIYCYCYDPPGSGWMKQVWYQMADAGAGPWGTYTKTAENPIPSGNPTAIVQDDGPP